ncbi:hypothetical protein BC830DRAFT_1151199 [Chytriomyces sp. MP71]|nr:hypothetical protein BC830DRAFT_1151199 [Chytriomyces sp. MP71]
MKVHSFLVPDMEAFDDECLVTSVHCTPELLLGIRTTFLLYSVAVFVASLIISNDQSYGFISNWTHFSVTLFLLVAVFNSYTYIANDENLSLMKERHHAVRYVIWIMYSIPASFSLIVSIVFFSTMQSQPAQVGALSQWVLISLNSTPSLVMLAELLLGRTPIVLVHILPFLLYGVSYIGVMFIYHSAEHGHPWPYALLDPNASYAWVVYSGTVLGFLAVFFAVAGVHTFRDRRRMRLGMMPIQTNFGMGRPSAGGEKDSDLTTVIV